MLVTEDMTWRCCALVQISPWAELLLMKHWQIKLSRSSCWFRTSRWNRWYSTELVWKLQVKDYSLAVGGECERVRVWERGCWWENWWEQGCNSTEYLALGGSLFLKALRGHTHTHTCWSIGSPPTYTAVLYTGRTTAEKKEKKSPASKEGKTPPPILAALPTRGLFNSSGPLVSLLDSLLFWG